MDGKSRHVLVAAVVVLAVVAGAGAAFAVTQQSSGGTNAAAGRQALFADVASQLGVQQSSGLSGAGPQAGGCGGASLAAAASYIGLSTDKLTTELRSGKSMAQVARANGKSVDGLKTAILNAAEKRLDQAVTDGNLTRAQANQILADKRSSIGQLVNQKGLSGPSGGASGQHWQGPPPGVGAPSLGGTPGIGSSSVQPGPSL
jgi:hypothetical protein